jgi:hypothetical protein
MPIYVIFNRKNGEIVQTHHHPDDLPVSREWLLAITDPEHNRDELDVTIVDPVTLEGGGVHRIDVTTGKLQVAETGQVRGFGTAGASRRPGPGAQRPTQTQTVFERRPPGPRRP